MTRAELMKVFGKEISRDTIVDLRSAGFLASGPRSPSPGAPYTYVTTKQFLSAFGFETLRDLPDIEALEDAGLLSRKADLRWIQMRIKAKAKRRGRRRRIMTGTTTRSGQRPRVCGDSS